MKWHTHVARTPTRLRSQREARHGGRRGNRRKVQPARCASATGCERCRHRSRAPCVGHPGLRWTRAWCCRAAFRTSGVGAIGGVVDPPRALACYRARSPPVGADDGAAGAPVLVRGDQSDGGISRVDHASRSPTPSSCRRQADKMRNNRHEPEAGTFHTASRTRARSSCSVPRYVDEHDRFPGA